MCDIGGYRRLGVWVLCLVLSACAAHDDRWPMDRDPAAREHPLIGRLWQPGAQAWITPVALRAALADNRFVLLGEQHDNAVHHRLQADLLATTIAAGRRPTVAFEMLDTAQQPALQRFLAQPDPNVQALGAAVGWADNGWPPWPQYAPIARVALAHSLPIVAANLPREIVRAVAREGFDVLEPARVRALGLRQPWPASRRKRLRRVLDAAHCNLLPAPALEGMAQAQRLRDAFMARRLHRTAGRDGAVLIAGAGHARTDFGVPLHLRETVPASEVFALALIPVRSDSRWPQDYAAMFQADRLPFDAVLFTPATPSGDSCAALRERFGKPDS